MRWWLWLYPPRWRRRYEEEFVALIEDRGWSVATALDVLRSVLDAWLHPGLAESTATLQPAVASGAGGGRFDRFTPRSRAVLGLAHDEAIRLGSAQIGTEHLLLGLLNENNGVAAHVLELVLGIQLEELRAAILGRIQPSGETATQPIGLSPSAKRAIELSVIEANRLHHRYLGTEHLLLGLLAEGEGIAADELRRREFGELSVMRRAILGVLTRGGSDLPPRM